jgi:hypothetical protein
MYVIENRHVPRNTSPLHATLTVDESAILAEVGERLIGLSATMPVTLIPLKSRESEESISQMFPGEPVCVCDFYLDGAEQWERVQGGFLSNRSGILNIDHHAEHSDMYRFISSGNLAARYVSTHGTFVGRIVNNHTDCDSVISRLIMGGELPPMALFEDAVIAADHSGKAHPVADLLQATESLRNLRFSARNLGLLLAGRELDPTATKLLNARRAARDETEQFVKAGRFQTRGSVAFLHFDGVLRNEFLPALIPDAAVFLTVEPDRDGSGLNIMRLRLGKGAPEGMTLFDLSVERFDPNYGGRWNAGANKRGGGSSIEVSTYADLLAGALEQYCSKRGIGRGYSALDTLLATSHSAETDQNEEVQNVVVRHQDIEIGGVGARLLGPVTMWGMEVTVQGISVSEFQDAILAAARGGDPRLAGYISSQSELSHTFHLSRLPRRVSLEVPAIEKFRAAGIALVSELSARGIAHTWCEEQPTMTDSIRSVIGLEEGYFEARRIDLVKTLRNSAITDLSMAQDIFLQRIGSFHEWGLHESQWNSVEDMCSALEGVSMSRRHSAGEVRELLGESFSVRESLIYSVYNLYEYSEPAVVVTGMHSYENLSQLAMAAAQLGQARVSLESTKSMKAYNLEIVQGSDHVSARFG